jgi:dihydroflavonol-4-reductase
LCRALVADGHQVCAFHRPNSPTLGLQGIHVEHAIGDITSPETLVEAMQGIEVVFHAAAMLGARSNRRGMYAVTVDGTHNVLEAARAAGVRRVVHTSSVAALGVPLESRGSPQFLMDENHTWNYPPDRWIYGHAKYMAEMEVQRFVARGLDAVIVNPAVVLGAGDLNRISGNTVIYVSRGFLKVAPPGGSNVVHIADVVAGHLAALKLGRSGERYILGGENISHRRLIETIAEVAGVGKPWVNLPAWLVRSLARPIAGASGFLKLPVNSEALQKVGHYFYYDTGKARSELNLPEPRSVRQAVEDTYQWYRKQGVIR